MKTFFQGLTFPELALAGKEQAKRAAKGHDDERIQEANHQRVKTIEPAGSCGSVPAVFWNDITLCAIGVL
ncbi:MAG: hypothetical protein C6W58_02195 [Bacillaceae bacterium]|jgi:hypothetical protein|uniref:hypothetical protein n=1 Tax=Aeribacillus TaxID=1055323 RepID=UPI000E385139|nr:hypothetical protein [Aeribacillus composti]MED0746757.1 hypothetical protein [Aeribacillus composti]REJ20766.1 MAG: hypothetical protein C6W58_02195 [Bacillaceae bacterium]